jgi:hypothetical protein
VPLSCARALRLSLCSRVTSSTWPPDIQTYVSTDVPFVGDQHLFKRCHTAFNINTAFSNRMFP